MAFAAINDITVHYELIGEATAKNLIVFSNSLGTDFRIWLPLFDELPEDYAALFYDSRGHGLTGGAEAEFGMADLVDDLIGLVDHLGIRRATFCGLSVGGIAVQGVYAKRPELMKRMILCNTAPKIGTADTWNTRIAQVEKDGMGAIGDSVMQRWFTPAFHEERPEDLAGYRTMLTRQSPRGYASTCAAIRDADLTAGLAAIALPTLVVVGDEDGATPPDLVRQAADAISGARFEIIDGCGHIPCVEQPEALAQLIQSFMKKA